MNEAAVLEPRKELYPENFGYKATELFVQLNDDVAQADADEFVNELGLSLQPCSDWGYCIIRTPIFEERSSIDYIVGEDEYGLFRRVEVNGMIEWDGMRNQVFSYHTWFIGFEIN